VMHKLKRISMFILNEVETSHILISIRLYFILTILINYGRRPSILSDCNFNSSAAEVSGIQGLWEGVEPVHQYGTRRAKKRYMNLWRAPLTFYLDFLILILFYIFNSNPQFWKKLGPKAVLFRLAKFLLEALVQSVDKSLRFVMA
jgi:hypothetical protein